MTELAIQRRNTVAFINADPVLLVLKYRPKVHLSDGGYRWGAEASREPQTFRIIPTSDIMPQVQTPDGVQLVPTYVILGFWDAIMFRWDKFTLEGVNYQIVSPIRPDFRSPGKSYERKADVARL